VEHKAPHGGQPDPAARLGLRIWTPPQDAACHVGQPVEQPASTPSDGLSGRLTLSEFYRQYHRPIVLEAAQDDQRANVRQYDESILLWAGLTGNPPLEEIDRRVCIDFKRALQARRWRGKPIRQNTVRKHMVYVQAVLSEAGPRTEGHPNRPRKRGLFGLDADGDPRLAPRLAIPPVERRQASRIYTIAQISRLIDAAEEATVPASVPGIAAADWWRALLTWLSWTGMRIGSALACRWDYFESGDSLLMPTELMKGRREQRYYIPSQARRMVELIRTADARLFPWPHQASWLHATRAKLEDRAGVPHYGFHGIRKCVCTELMQLNPAVAQMVMGHISRDVSLRYYTSATIIPKVVDRLPVPGGLVQRRLF